MSTAVIRICKCDRCGARAEAPNVTSLPAGWSQLVVEGPTGRRPTADLCPGCTTRAAAYDSLVAPEGEPV